MRNTFHLVIGFTIGYISLIIFGLNDVPIDKEHLNNVLVIVLSGFVAGVIGYLWEYWQNKQFGAKSDMKDALRTALGGCIGGFVSLFFVSWFVVIPLVIISALLVIFKYKK